MQDDDKPKEPKQPERPSAGSPDRRRGPRQRKDFVERATARGHSGYGVESVRPHLRDQLKLKALMQPTFPPPAEARGKDDHHVG
jgi:hypothetical protein